MNKRNSFVMSETNAAKLNDSQAGQRANHEHFKEVKKLRAEYTYFTIIFTFTGFDSKFDKYNYSSQ